MQEEMKSHTCVREHRGYMGNTGVHGEHKGTWGTQGNMGNTREHGEHKGTQGNTGEHGEHKGTQGNMGNTREHGEHMETEEYKGTQGNMGNTGEHVGNTGEHRGIQGNTGTWGTWEHKGTREHGEHRGTWGTWKGGHISIAGIILVYPVCIKYLYLCVLMPSPCLDWSHHSPLCLHIGR